MNIKAKRRLFTLVEILLVIGIIVLITGVTGVNIRRLYLEQKYTTEVNLIVDTLRIAQDLMMILQTDVTVNFKKNDKESIIEYAIQFDKPPSKQWVNILTKKHPPLKTIKTLVFDAVSAPIGSPKDGITLNFFSRGTVMSKGILRISPYADEHEIGPLNRFICLKGYPAPINVQTEKANLCNFEKESDYFSRLTDLTKSEVPNYEDK